MLNSTKSSTKKSGWSYSSQQCNTIVDLAITVYSTHTL